MAEESEESKEDNTGENVVIPRDEKYRLFANKYQIVLEDDEGRKLTMQHPFATVQECEEEAGKINTRHPFHEVMWDGQLKMKWRTLNVYKRSNVYPYTCDWSKSYYSEEATH